MEASTGFEAFSQARIELNRVLVGHNVLVERLLGAIICGGHLLIEGAPGLAKTRAVNCFADVLAVSFSRVQATPDLMPADLTGTNVYEQGVGQFKFHEGPLFNHVVLVDEINRAPPKVQSALLEAMAERQISAGGVTRQLPNPFMVVATQNPIEMEGTYPLPEAQLDRFMFFVNVELPNLELERKIIDLVLEEGVQATTASQIAPVLQQAVILEVRQAVRKIYLSESIRDYIARLVVATRGEGQAGEYASVIEHAASPRASIFIAQASQAVAWLQNRDHVIPEDVKQIVSDVLAGRLVLNYEAQAKGTTTRQVVAEIVEATPVL